MGKGSGRSKRRSGDRKVSSKASTRGNGASVIRGRGIVDQSVCLWPRCCPSSPLFEARHVQAHPRLPGIIRQSRPQSHVECSQAHIQRCAWGPPSHIRDVLGVRVACRAVATLRVSLSISGTRDTRGPRCLSMLDVAMASTRGARPIDSPPPSGCASHPLPVGEGASSRCRAVDNTYRQSPR